MGERCTHPPKRHAAVKPRVTIERHMKRWYYFIRYPNRASLLMLPVEEYSVAEMVSQAIEWQSGAGGCAVQLITRDML